MKVRLNGPRAWGKRLAIGWQVTDPDERHLLSLENGVLNHRPWKDGAEPEATLIVERRALERAARRQRRPRGARRERSGCGSRGTR